mmetsp:Transcript_2604/g.6566  ORF Transcript_2604/g.6566 Transcript_2604/m.6566 type:complete len:414 (-) Transcript_2604:2518-3759(-)
MNQQEQYQPEAEPEHQVMSCTATMDSNNVTTTAPTSTTTMTTTTTTPEFQHWLAQAHDGDANAQYRIGTCYLQGHEGCQLDEQAALEWFQKAAAQGHANAQYQYGWCYEAGTAGLPKDRCKAVAIMSEILTHTADSTTACPHAQCYLGWCHFNGEGGLPVNQAEGVRLFQLAVDQGLSEAQFHLANCYREGQGVPKKDLPKAIRLYQAAAQQQHAGAQNNLGNRYYHGQGVERHLGKAVAWCTKAARQGNEYGMATVGECYRDGGPGLEQDLYEAVTWFQMALEAGYEPAADEICQLQQKLRRRLQRLPVVRNKGQLALLSAGQEECPCCFEPFSDTTMTMATEQPFDRPRIMLPSCGHCYCMECLHSMCKMAAQQQDQQQQRIIKQPGVGNCAMCRRQFRLKNVKRVVSSSS